MNGFNSVSAIATAAAWSYGLALAGYLAFAIRVGLGWSRSLRAALLLAATLATALWAGAGLLIALQDSPSAWLLAKSADALRYGIWFAFVWSLLEGARRADAQPGLPTLFPRWAVALVAAALLARVALSEELPLAQALGPTAEVVLLRGHGNVVVGPSIQVAVFRAYYTEINARQQLNAMILGRDDVVYMNAGECETADRIMQAVAGRPWDLWKRRVRREMRRAEAEDSL